MEIYEQIRFMKEHEHMSQRAAARRLGISRNTVKKYWNGETFPGVRKPGSGRHNDVVTDEVIAFIKMCLDADKSAPKKQHHTAHKIYTRLTKELDFKGSETAIRKAVADLRPNPNKVFVPLAFEPGEAIQIDWGEATVYIDNVKRKVQTWCMRECYSGNIFVAAFYRQNEESFLEGILKGLEYFGGTPSKIIFDNARVAVKEGFGTHAKSTDKYASMAAHYAFSPVYCNVASGHEKGLVEGLVGFSRRNFLVPVPYVKSIDALNESLLQKCYEYASHKIPMKPATVGEMYETAKAHLITLSPYRFDTAKTIQVRPNDFSLVTFERNRYSIPYQYSLKDVTLKAYANHIEILSGGKRIAQYDRDYSSEHTHYRLEHYIDLIERKPRSAYNAAPIKETVPKELCDFIYKLKTPKEIVKTLRLYLNYGDTVMENLQAASSYDTLYALVINESVPASKNTECDIKIKVPDLRQYDNLLNARCTL